MSVWLRACAVLLAVSGCSVGSALAPAAHIRPSADYPFGARMQGTTAGKPYTFGFVQVCLDRPGRAVVQDVRVENPNGLSVDAFATRPVRWGLEGNHFRPLGTHDGFRLGERTVRGTCTDHRYTQLGLQFSRHGRSTGTGDAIIVHYRSAGEVAQTRIPFIVTLCAPDDADTRGCRPTPPEDPHARSSKH